MLMLPVPTSTLSGGGGGDTLWHTELGGLRPKGLVLTYDSSHRPKNIDLKVPLTLALT